MEEIIEEAKWLARKGVKELQLIAQDLTYYGLDLYRTHKLPELVQRLSEIDGIEWIRLHYGYPNNFPYEILDVMKNNLRSALISISHCNIFQIKCSL